MSTSNYQDLVQLPIVRASKYGQPTIVKLLFDKGATPCPQAMVEAIKAGYTYTDN